MDEDLIGPRCVPREVVPPTPVAKGSFRFGWVAEWKLRRWLAGSTSKPLMRDAVALGRSTSLTADDRAWVLR